MKTHTLVACLALGFAGGAGADTFTVTNSNDSGSGSLRTAITDANTHPNIDLDVPDVIAFAIPGTGVHTITLNTALPSITDPVTIDGYTQPGASENTLGVGDNAVLLIELNGANLGGTALGLDLAGGRSALRGLVVNRFGSNPFAFAGSGGVRVASDDNIVAGNFFGCNPAGTAALANVGFSVTVDSGIDNIIGGTTPADRNLFASDAVDTSSSGGTGIQVRNSQPGTRIQGNYIGTNAAGDAALGNFRGIDVVGFTSADLVIGGLTSTPGRGAGNVISGNSSNGGINNHGIFVANRPGDLTIQGNLIGLNASGTAALPNGVSGINFQDAVPGSGTLLIGGTAANARNVIFSNRIAGIVSNALGLSIQGNYIGTDITGTVRLEGGTGVGITLGGSATIGGTASGAGNVISCSGLGVRIYGGDVTVQGNFFGTGADGVTMLGNNAGLSVENDAVATIGGTAAGAGNVIALQHPRRGDGQEHRARCQSGATRFSATEWIRPRSVIPGLT